MNNRKIGLGLIISSLSVLLVDRISSIISTYLGKLYCGEQYMQPVDGVVGNLSCGFNADMYLVIVLLVVLLMGIIIFRFHSKQK